MTGYTCLRCQLRLLRRSRTPAPLSPVRNLKTLGAPSRLTDHRIRRYATAAEAPSDTRSSESTIGTAFPHNEFDHSIRVGPAENLPPVLQTEDSAGGTPSVRDHLRAWSANWQEQKELELRDSVTGSQLIWKLPDSLFLDSHNNVTTEAGENEADADSVDDMIEGEHRHALALGDLLYFKPGAERQQYGVFVGQAGVQSLYILETGRFIQVTGGGTSIAREPGFITPEEAKAIRAALPKQHIEKASQPGSLPTFAVYQGDAPKSIRHLCQDLASKIRRFRNEVVAFRRSHVELLDSLYERMAHEDDYVKMPFYSFVEALLGRQQAKLSAAGRMAIFVMACAQPTKLQLWHGTKVSQVEVLLGPKTLHRQMDSVIDWARDYQELAALASKGHNVQSQLRKNPVNQFINKARTIITESRKLRSPTTIGCLGPSKQTSQTNGKITKRPSGSSFTESDISVIEFIYNVYVRRPGLGEHTIHHAIASLILRGIGAYPKMTLEGTIGRLLLQELGALKPWAEPYDDNVNVPLLGRRGAEKFTRLYAEAEQHAASLGFKAGSSEIPLPDAFADLRIDLGDMPVYVIDGADTTVRDDGLSFQESEDRPGCYWVHVHAAHPSAFIDPSSLFGQVAKEVIHTWFTSEKTCHMFPDVVSKAFSLSAGSPTLTTSTLLDPDGKVVDIRVRPTRVHNLIILHPQGIEELLGKPQPDSTTLVVGVDPAIPIEEPRAVIDEEIAMAKPHMPVLSIASKRLEARTLMRLQEQKETADFMYQHRVTGYSVNAQQTFQSSSLHESVHYVGDPTIRITAPTHPWKGKWSTLSGQWGLVQQCMVLSGESTAKWMADRRMPAVFFGSLPDPEFPLSKINSATREENFLSPKATMRAEPVPHVTMALAQYSKVTSPIRRYDDLLTQWNIDSYLLAEARGEVQNGGPLPETHKFPFSAEAITKHLADDAWLLAANSKQEKAAKSHWALQALFRAFHFKEAELPEIMYAQARSTSAVDRDIHPLGSTISGNLEPFDIRCVFMATDPDWLSTIKRSQYVPVKIEKVAATHQVVYVRAVGPPVDEVPRAEKPGNVYYLSKERREAMEREAMEREAIEKAAKEENSAEVVAAA